MGDRAEQLELAHDADAPRASRRFIARVLRQWSVDAEVVERTQLLVSELVSNAVLHGRGPICVAVQAAVGHPGFRVEVRNVGHGQPIIRRPAPDDVSGRGMQIVDKLAAGWGSVTGDGETSVWFEMHADAST